MSTNLFSKMYRPKYLQGKEVKVFRDKLGISIKGMDSFNMPGKNNPNRKVALQLVEGLAACLMGYVKRTAWQTNSNNPRTVLCELDTDAYQDSHTAKFADARQAVAFPDHHLCGANFSDRKIFTEIGSTSTVTGSTNTGKTEPSVFISALMTAIAERRQNNPDALSFLTAYQKVLDELTQVSALPLKTAGAVTGTAGVVVPPTLERSLLLAAEGAYEWLAYGGEAERSSAPPTPYDWDVEKHSITSLPNYRKESDFSDMLTDSVQFSAFVASGAFPHENTASAAASATGPVPPLSTAPTANTSAKRKNSSRAATAKAAAKNTAKKAKPQRENCPPYFHGIRDSSRIRMPRGGSYSVLLKGPAGTGKTWAVFNADGMPTNRVGVSSETDAPLLLGEFNRDEDGTWKPFLGSIASVVRAAMLEAMLIQFKRGRRLEWKNFKKHKKHPLVKCLKILQSDPQDAEARIKLGELANPTAPASWAIINDAYFALEAPEVGPVRRLFLDEIWDSAGNKEVTTVLKFLMEDERRVILSRCGAGWCDLFAYNVHLVAAGNPDESFMSGVGLSRAIRSRFGFTYGVGYCEETEEINRTHAGTNSRLKPIAQPAGFNLEKSDYDPPLMPKITPSQEVIQAAVTFGRWTREAFRAGELGELLDPRGVDQLAFTAAYFEENFEVSGKQAFQEAVETVVDRLCEMDDLGLPLEKQRETVKQKAGTVGINL